MTASASIPPPALQDRSRRKQSQILASGTRLLELGGPDALTVAAVAEDAGVSVGSVYRRFGNKSHLLDAIQRSFIANFVEEFRTGTSAPTAPAAAVRTPTDTLHGVVTALARTFCAHARLLRVFIVIGTQQPAVMEVGSQAARDCGTAFAALLEPTTAAIRGDDPSGAIAFAYTLVYSACEHRVLHELGFEHEAALGWDDFATELGTAVSLFLFSR